MNVDGRWHRIGTLFIVASVGCGCGRLRDSRDVKKRSPAMVLMDGAQEVVYYDNYDPTGKPELEQISYVLSAPFPADGVICHISQQLAKNGWRPLQRTHDDSGTPSSYVQGWRVIINRRGASDEHHVDLWDAEWVNAEGDQLSYSLTYRYPSRGAANKTRLRVGGIREPASTVSPADRAKNASGGEVPTGQPPHLAPDNVAQCLPGTSS
jgi:hypothetical protein